MLERKGDLWDGQIVVITTNGFVKRNGAAVMGRGCAKEATIRYPGIEFKLGEAIHKYGNIVIDLGYQKDGKRLITFPVKPIEVKFNGSNVVKHMKANFRPGGNVPGWAAIADINIIERSAYQLRTYIDMLNIQLNITDKIFMPRPGCGAGELQWEEVKPILEKYLDDRFIVCHK